MSTLAVGQEVRVITSGNRYQPSQVVPGRVIKVARKYTTVEYEPPGWNRSVEVKFSIETGIENVDYQPMRFRTLDEQLDFERREAALATIDAAGLKLGTKRDSYRLPNLTLEQWEQVAALVASWGLSTDD